MLIRRLNLKGTFRSDIRSENWFVGLRGACGLGPQGAPEALPRPPPHGPRLRGVCGQCTGSAPLCSWAQISLGSGGNPDTHVHPTTAYSHWTLRDCSSPAHPAPPSRPHPPPSVGASARGPRVLLQPVGADLFPEGTVISEILFLVRGGLCPGPLVSLISRNVFFCYICSSYGRTQSRSFGSFMWVRIQGALSGSLRLPPLP